MKLQAPEAPPRDAARLSAYLRAIHLAEEALQLAWTLSAPVSAPSPEDVAAALGAPSGDSLSSSRDALAVLAAEAAASEIASEADVKEASARVDRLWAAYCNRQSDREHLREMATIDAVALGARLCKPEPEGEALDLDDAIEFALEHLERMWPDAARAANRGRQEFTIAVEQWSEAYGQWEACASLLDAIAGISEVQTTRKPESVRRAYGHWRRSRAER